MTPTEQEAYRKLQEEIKRCKSQGENNLIICNGKIIQYAPKKFRTHVLINNPPTPVENNDTSAENNDAPSVTVVAESIDPSADDQNDVRMTQDSTNSS